MTHDQHEQLSILSHQLYLWLQAGEELRDDLQALLDAEAQGLQGTQGDFNAPHQLAAEAQRIEEAEALIQKYPRVTQHDFDKLRALLAEAETDAKRIGEEDDARRKRLGIREG